MILIYEQKFSKILKGELLKENPLPKFELNCMKIHHDPV